MSSGGRLLVVVSFALWGCIPVVRETLPKNPCDDIVFLSRSGEHMAAIDRGRALGEGLATCPATTRAALSASYNVVNRADSLVRVAFAERRNENFIAAREKFQAALDVYPKYYWVQKLLRGIDSSIRARVRELEEEAKYLVSRGNLREASARLREALLLLPEDKPVAAALVNVEARIDAETARSQAYESLRTGRSLAEQGRFDDAMQVLRQGKADEILPSETNALLQYISNERKDRVKVLLNSARDEVGKGNYDEAVRLLEAAVDGGPAGPDLDAELVEFSRQVGTSLYGQGKLHRAREVWLLALGADPNNGEILQYLENVQVRLDKLERIQRQSDPPSPPKKSE